MLDITSIYLEKAAESLAGADSEFANRRFDNCANRCYYACFQAAIGALLRAGTRPPGGAEGPWGHAFVQAQFNGQLINRRKLYAANLRDVLTRSYLLRQTADYSTKPVGQTETQRALRRARDFVTEIFTQGGAAR